MNIERKYYTESMGQMDEEEELEDLEELVQGLVKLREHMEQTIQRPDPEKQKWFEDLASRVLEFAEVCELDVKMEITGEQMGRIQFETSCLELSWLEPPEIRAFWIYLNKTAGQCRISKCPKVFRIEFFYPLFSVQRPV